MEITPAEISNKFKLPTTATYLLQKYNIATS